MDGNPDIEHYGEEEGGGDQGVNGSEPAVRGVAEEGTEG